MRLVLLFVFFFVPLGGLSLPFVGLHGLIVVAATVLVFMITLSFSCNLILTDLLMANDDVAEALKNTVKITTKTTVNILRFSDPSPVVIVGKSLKSLNVYVSQGLLISLKESDLRLVLGKALALARKDHLVITTMASVLSAFTFKLLPRAWTDVLLRDEPMIKGNQGLTVSSFIAFVFVYPSFKFFRFLANGATHKAGARRHTALSLEPALGSLVFIPSVLLNSLKETRKKHN